jgi:hypothetical protein
MGEEHLSWSVQRVTLYHGVFDKYRNLFEEKLHCDSKFIPIWELRCDCELTCAANILACEVKNSRHQYIEQSAIEQDTILFFSFQIDATTPIPKVQNDGDSLIESKRYLCSFWYTTSTGKRVQVRLQVFFSKIP